MRIRKVNIHDERTAQLLEIITDQGIFKKHINNSKIHLINVIEASIKKGIRNQEIVTFNDLCIFVHDFSKINFRTIYTNKAST